MQRLRLYSFDEVVQAVAVCGTTLKIHGHLGLIPRPSVAVRAGGKYYTAVDLEIIRAHFTKGWPLSHHLGYISPRQMALIVGVHEKAVQDGIQSGRQPAPRHRRGHGGCIPTLFKTITEVLEERADALISRQDDLEGEVNDLEMRRTHSQKIWLSPESNRRLTN